MIALGSATVDAYLARLGVAFERPDQASLDRLVDAHLRAVPFHNLDLLENAGCDVGLPPIEAAVERAISGQGGTCHQLSPPFAALLRSLGFDAHLAAATVARAGDHLVVVVRLGGDRLVCDVANGQPYMRAFPLDGREYAIERYGWSIRFGPADRGFSMRRRLPDGTWRCVYTMYPAPREYSTFASIIRDHHTQVGFGPFLSGLRAVRMTASCLLALRDRTYERHTVDGVQRRVIPDAGALDRLLRGPFGLEEPPLASALSTLRRNAPAAWAGWGSPVADVAAECERSIEAEEWSTAAVQRLRRIARANPLGDNDPRVLIALTLTDRPAAFTRFSRSLRQELAAFGVAPERVAVLALENSSSSAARARDKRTAVVLRGAGIDTEIVAAPTTRLPLAAARRTLTDLLRHRVLGRVVWVIDDDMELDTLVLRRGRLTSLRVFSYFHRIARLYRDHPEISVGLGGNTGAPPVPAHAIVRCQLIDIRDNLEELMRRPPDEPYVAPANPRELRDYYYDHAEGDRGHLRVPFRWEPRRARTVRDALIEMFLDWPEVLCGQGVTRPLTYAGEREPTPSNHRGGNAIFFDTDALFAVPLPAGSIAGVPLRRGDTVWATMAERAGFGLSAISLPLLHGRAGAIAATEAEEPDTLIIGVLAQAWGTVVSRLVAQSSPPTNADAERLLEERLQRMEDGFGAVGQLVGEVHALLADLRSDADGDLRAAIGTADSAVSEVGRRYSRCVKLPRPPVSAEIATMAQCMRCGR